MNQGHFGIVMAEVIILPEDYWVFDFTRGEDPDFICPYPYQIGRYDEIRPGMYTHELFEGTRDLAPTSRDIAARFHRDLFVGSSAF